jgi:prepilin-type N-terminal cleavage/methylation domain-containing protein
MNHDVCRTRASGRIAVQTGFTLVELLVAAALVLVVASVLGVLAHGMPRAFDRSLAITDLTARARAGLGVISFDVQAAGSGIVIGPALQGLADLWPIVVPGRSLGDPSLASPFAAVSVLRATGAQGELRDLAGAGSVALTLDAAAPSAQQDGTGGFEAGDQALIIDSARAESVVVRAVGAASWTLTLSSPLRTSFPPRALIVGVERITYGLRPDPAGGMRLVKRSGGGAEQPVVDHVGEFEVMLWGSAEPPLPGTTADSFPTFGPLAPPVATDDGRDSWPPGENCTLALDGAGLRVARLPQRGPAGALVPLTAAMLSDGPWCPDAADPEAFDADLLRLRRVDLRLRFDMSSPDDGPTVLPLSLVSSTTLRQR